MFCCLVTKMNLVLLVTVQVILPLIGHYNSYIFISQYKCLVFWGNILCMMESKYSPDLPHRESAFLNQFFLTWQLWHWNVSDKMRLPAVLYTHTGRQSSCVCVIPTVLLGANSDWGRRGPLSPLWPRRDPDVVQRVGVESFEGVLRWYGQPPVILKLKRSHFHLE